MFKTFCRYICILLLLLFIQTTVLLPLGNYGIRPDLVLFVVIFASISLPAVPCTCIVFIAGFCLEALSGSPSGFFISTYFFIFATIRLACVFFNISTLIEMLGLLLLSLTAKYLLVCFLMFFIYEYQYESILRTVVNETFFTIVAFPVIFPFIRKYGALPPEAA